MPPELRSRIPLGRIGPHTHGQERPGSSPQNEAGCVPHLLLVYSRIPQARGLCLSSRKAASTGISGYLSVPFYCRHVSPEVGVARQLVTCFVSLCCFVLATGRHQVRQDDGRYLLGTVPPVHDQVMLPPCVRADSTRMLDWIATFAFAVPNDTVILPAGARSSSET